MTVVILVAAGLAAMAALVAVIVAISAGNQIEALYSGRDELTARPVGVPSVNFPEDFSGFGSEGWERDEISPRQYGRAVFEVKTSRFGAIERSVVRELFDFEDDRDESAAEVAAALSQLSDVPDKADRRIGQRAVAEAT